MLKSNLEKRSGLKTDWLPEELWRRTYRVRVKLSGKKCLDEKEGTGNRDL